MILEDEMHSIMLNEFMKLLEEHDSCIDAVTHKLAPNVPYNYYGYRGEVDIVKYFTMRKSDMLAIYELKPKIYNLDRTIGKLNQYAEFFVRDFVKNHRKVDCCFVNLVLLNTKENCQLIDKFFEIFEKMFLDPQMYIEEFDQTEKRIVVTELDSIDKIERYNHLILYNPIKQKMMYPLDLDECKHILLVKKTLKPQEWLQHKRNVKIILKNCWDFKDVKDFKVAWKEKEDERK